MTVSKNKFRLGITKKRCQPPFHGKSVWFTPKKLASTFVEISVDETDERRARLDWSDEEIYELRRLCEKHQMPFQSMCLSAHRKFPFGSMDDAIHWIADHHGKSDFSGL